MVQLSVVLITQNEEHNLPRTLASVQPLVNELGGEIIVVDSGSTDRTREIAQSFGARVFVEAWKGFAAQKNSAIDKAQGDWVLLLDADEEVSAELATGLRTVIAVNVDRLTEEFRREEDRCDDAVEAHLAIQEKYGAEFPEGKPAAVYKIPRRNLFLGRWIKHGGYWPDRKLRLFRRGFGHVEERAVHETVKLQGCGNIGTLRGALIHHAYPTLDIYREHMHRYAALGAEMLRHQPRAWLWLNRWLNPPLTFFYNYFLRLGFLDGRAGLLLHFHHSRYVSWKYAQALALKKQSPAIADDRGPTTGDGSTPAA